MAFGGGVVLVEVDLPDAAVNRLSLADAITTVGSLASEIGPVLAAVFGGGTPLPLVSEDQDETTDKQAS